MNRRFLIPIMELDSAWCLRGYSHVCYAKEYCNGVLKIPLNYIKESRLCNAGIEVELKDIEKTAQEDWYIALMTLSKSKKEST